MEKIHLKPKGVSPAISILNAVANLDLDEVFIKCRKETFHAVKEYFDSLHTEPPICVGKRVVGVRVKYDCKTPPNQMVLLPSNTVFIWW